MKSLQRILNLVHCYKITTIMYILHSSGVPGGGGFGGFNPPPQIPKAVQNHAKLNPIVKTVKNW